MRIENLNCTHSILQVIGCIMHSPSLLEEYPLTGEDFEVEKFHEIIFSSISNLYSSGVQVIDGFSIDTFISGYERQYKIFTDNKGNEYVNDAYNFAELNNFLYHYHRMKKFSYLRFLEKQGNDTRWLYDSITVEPSEQEKQMAKLDGMTIDDMIDLVDNRFVNEARLKFSMNTQNKGQLAGKGLKALKENLKITPEIGIPLQSKIMNTVARGARLKKLYLRSSNSGGGKTRLGVGDLCSYSIPWFYDLENKKWIHSGFAEPTLFISTELSVDEVQTIIVAYISGVNEYSIINGTYVGDEEERVDQAIIYIESSPFWIEELFDFNIKAIEILIKKYKREKLVSYINFDYIHTSVSLIGELASSSKGMKLREDQILFMLIDKLKNLCNTLNVHIDTSTQVTGEYKDVREKDNTILRGAKSLSDRVDLGVISLAPSSAELDGIKSIMSKQINMPLPNCIQHVYKVRRGRLTKIRIWQYIDLGTCRTRDLFVTDNDYNLIPVEETIIENLDALIEQHSILESDMVAETEEDEDSRKTLITFDW